MKKVSDRIKSLRLAGETQAMFAERLGTTQASISRYINGRQPDRETLIKISKRTGTSLDWLLTGGMAGDSGKGKSDAELLQTALAQISEISEIPARERGKLSEMIRDVATKKQVRKDLMGFWESKSRKR